jgi:hypothetical protein
MNSDLTPTMLNTIISLGEQELLTCYDASTVGWIARAVAVAKYARKLQQAAEAEEIARGHIG